MASTKAISPGANKAAVRKAAVKKATVKKAAVKKAVRKRVSGKTRVSKTAVKKSPAGKKAVKKTAGKKQAVKKSDVRKTDLAIRKTATQGVGELIGSLATVPVDAFIKFLSGNRLTAKTAKDLQAAFDRVRDVASNLAQASDSAEGGEFECLNGPDPRLMNAQAPIWNALMDYYFRLEFEGWENLPDEPGLLIGIHSGGPLTMDAWTVALAWWRHFGEQRTLHGTAHDMLMSWPGLGRYFKRLGVITPTRENMLAAFQKGDDVVLWPGGEFDAYRTWKDRDKAILAGRKGFIRLAIRANVPIVPVATVGGHDTLFVLSEGRELARKLKLKDRMRIETAPVTLSVPFGVTLHLTPFQHIPLPAKIRTQIMEPIYLDSDPARVDDQKYVDEMYDLVESTIQKGMTELAKRRKFPIWG